MTHSQSSTTPVVEQVHEHPAIYQISVALPDNPLRNLNVYLLQSEGESLVIDTGFNRAECHADLWAGLRACNVDLAHTSLFLTHLHSDHTGLVKDFQDAGCPIYMSQTDYDICTHLAAGNWDGLFQIYSEEGFPQDLLARQADENQAQLYAPKKAFCIQPIRDQTRIQIGACELVCLHTPGHTPGHMMLYLPQEQIVFSGDHVLFHITPNIGIWDRTSDALGDYLQSLEQLRALPAQHTFPAHRARGEDFHARLTQLQAHHEERLAELEAAIEAHPDCDAYTLAGYLTWSARGLPWAQFPPHQQWFAMGETLSHLYHLCQRKRITRSVGARILYRRS